MKILWFVVGMLVMLAALCAGGFAAAALTDGSSSAGLFVLGILPLSVLGVTPVMTGAILAQWPVDPREAQGRPYFVRLAAIVGAVTVVCVILLAVFFGVVGAPPWLAVAGLVVAVLLVAAAFPIGEWLRRRDARTPRPEVHFSGVTSEELGASRRKITLWSVGAFVVTSAGCLVLFRFTGDGKHDLPASYLVPALGFGLSFGALAGMFVTLLIVVPLNRAMRDALGKDLAERKAINRVVVKGKAQDLAPEAEARASRFAAVARVALPFQLAQQFLLFAALFAQRGVTIADGDDIFPGFSIGFVIFFGLLLVAVMPMSFRRLARVRRYSDAHPVVQEGVAA